MAAGLIALAFATFATLTTFTAAVFASAYLRMGRPASKSLITDRQGNV